MSDLMQQLRNPTNSGETCKRLVLDAAEKIAALNEKLARAATLLKSAGHHADCEALSCQRTSSPGGARKCGGQEHWGIHDLSLRETHLFKPGECDCGLDEILREVGHD